ncbi:MAG: glutamyl-tRNA reductase [bacterium]|nr:glutamyl-tRNA reductase [bacterium]
MMVKVIFKLNNISMKSNDIKIMNFLFQVCMIIASSFHSFLGNNQREQSFITMVWSQSAKRVKTGRRENMNQRTEPSASHFIVLSFNHQKLSLQDLRRFLLEESEIQPFLNHLRQYCWCDEALGLRTCNRIEFYVVVSAIHEGLAGLLNAIAERFQTTVEELLSVLSVQIDSDAVAHVTRLASGLESMVIGDGQILGQLKKAYQDSQNEGDLHPSVNVLFQKVFSIAKRVRNETGLGKGRVSISALAVEFAKEHFGSLHGVRAAVIGAGKMSGLAARYLRQAGVKELRIVNRTLDSALDLAKEVNGSVYGLDELDRAVAESDLVISGTAASEPIITPALFESPRLRDGKPRMLIDIALPSDVDPAVAELEGVTLVHLDDLRSCARRNEANRADELTRAEAIVEEELNKLGPWPLTFHLNKIAKHLGDFADRIYQEELDELFGEAPGLTAEQQEAIAARMKRMAERIVLAPRRNLRKGETLRACPDALKCLAEVFRESSGARSLPVVQIEPAPVKSE